VSRVGHIRAFAVLTAQTPFEAAAAETAPVAFEMDPRTREEDTGRSADEQP
jgi:hypothetical protein